MKKDQLWKLIQNRKYSIIEKVAQGSAGVILSAVKIPNNEDDPTEDCILKVIPLDSKLKKKLYKREIKVMKKLSSSELILGIRSHFEFRFDGIKYGVFEFEKMDQDLMDLILCDEYSIDQTQSQLIFHRICKSVQYCHQRGIYHLDIKGDNILLSINDDHQIIDIKLCDFGFSRMKDDINNQATASPSSSSSSIFSSFFRSSSSSSPRFDGKLFGTEEYLPIEYFNDEYPLMAEKVDVWALGVLLFTLITKCYPFNFSIAKNFDVEYERGLLDVSKKCKSFGCKSLLISIFHRNPQLRPSVSEILNHRWFSILQNTFSVMW